MPFVVGPSQSLAKKSVWQLKSLADTAGKDQGMMSSLSADHVTQGPHESMMSSNYVKTGLHENFMSSDCVSHGKHETVMSSDCVPHDQHETVMSSDCVPHDQHETVISSQYADHMSSLPLRNTGPVLNTLKIEKNNQQVENNIANYDYACSVRNSLCCAVCLNIKCIQAKPDIEKPNSSLSHCTTTVGNTAKELLHITNQPACPSNLNPSQEYYKHWSADQVTTLDTDSIKSICMERKIDNSSLEDTSGEVTCFLCYMEDNCVRNLGAPPPESDGNNNADYPESGEQAAKGVVCDNNVEQMTESVSEHESGAVTGSDCVNEHTSNEEDANGKTVDVNNASVFTFDHVNNTAKKSSADLARSTSASATMAELLGIQAPTVEDSSTRSGIDVQSTTPASTETCLSELVKDASTPASTEPCLSELFNCGSTPANKQPHISELVKDGSTPANTEPHLSELVKNASTEPCLSEPFKDASTPASTQSHITEHVKDGSTPENTEPRLSELIKDGSTPANKQPHLSELIKDGSTPANKQPHLSELIKDGSTPASTKPHLSELVTVASTPASTQPRLSELIKDRSVFGVKYNTEKVDNVLLNKGRRQGIHDLAPTLSKEVPDDVGSGRPKRFKTILPVLPIDKQKINNTGKPLIPKMAFVVAKAVEVKKRRSSLPPVVEGAKPSGFVRGRRMSAALPRKISLKQTIPEHGELNLDPLDFLMESNHDKALDFGLNQHKGLLYVIGLSTGATIGILGGLIIGIGIRIVMVILPYVA